MARADEPASGDPATLDGRDDALTTPSAPELAATALASAGGVLASREPAPPLVGVLGRYRIERELGRGGMGVVYQAFDPELERRVALKVLPRMTADDARLRLQREARAMARLASPNVCTVFEVGTLEGQDFVAMELMEAGTLADWLHARRRTTREILTAFLAAGRGLADAHAAGLVHRDFKPANVLRARDGRFAVTDFGLARDATTAPPIVVRESAPVSVVTPLALDDVTQTGWVLGTPQYMAPEQWENHEVTPASDQFAFCVSLWEATSGARPFLGSDADALHAAVSRGPRELDASAVPRALRAILRRGLDPDPARRWPSMDRLLVVLQRAQRRPARIAQAIVALVVIGGIAAVLAWPHGPSACTDPVRDPDAVWTPEARAALVAAGLGDGVEMIDRDVRDWHARWAAVCHAPAAQPVRACLDGVAGHLGAVVDIAREATLDPSSAGLLLSQLVPPAVCAAPVPPRLLARWSPAAQHALGELEKASHLSLPSGLDPDDLAPMPGAEDPCAQTIAIRTRIELHLSENDEPGSSDPKAVRPDSFDNEMQCPDDRLLADLVDVELDGGGEVFSPNVFNQRIDALERRYDRFGDPITHGQVEDARGVIAEDAGDEAAAIALYHASARDFASRQIQGREVSEMASELELRFARWNADDQATVPAELAKALAMAPGHRAKERLAQLAIQLRWSAGDHASARVPSPRSGDDPLTVPSSGVVVDAAGHPVAGATVVTAQFIAADELGFASGLGAESLSATTGADGTFAFPTTTVTGFVVAFAGPARSPAMRTRTGLRLELAPTRTIRGVVHRAGAARGHAVVAAGEIGHAGLRVFAPIADDGSFTIAGAPRGPVQIGVLDSVRSPSGVWLDVPGSGDLAGVTLDAPARTRTLTVISRSATMAPLTLAHVAVYAGTPAMRVAGDLDTHEIAADAESSRAAPGEKLPGHDHADDLIAIVRKLPATGPLTACVFGLFQDPRDPEARRTYEAHRDELEIPCRVVGEGEAVITIDVAPNKRVE